MRALACAVALGAALGCRVGAPSPYSPSGESERNSVAAERLSREGALALEANDLEGAERLLRAALGEDLFFGPAHNNLGVVFLAQDKLYEAAQEFEWAQKLMHGHPDPRVNLGITLERAGRDTGALTAYRAGLEVAPGHIPSMQGAARLALRQGARDEATSAMLAAIALEGESDAWRQWARRELARAEAQ